MSVKLLGDNFFMKKIFLFLFIISFAISCGKGSDIANQIRVSGSTSVAPLMTKLAEDFEAKNPDYKVLIESVGSSIGIRDTIEGKNDLGMSSRSLKPSEVEEVNEIVLCQDAIVLVVNVMSTLDSITKEELINLYMKNMPIGDITKAVSREDGSGTRASFTELTGVALDEILPSTVEILDGTGKVKTSIANDSQKLGYISFGSVDETVKPIAYTSITNGMPVYASLDAVVSGEYELYRPFLLVSKKDIEEKPQVKIFLDYLKSKDANAIIVENGYIPNM